MAEALGSGGVEVSDFTASSGIAPYVETAGNPWPKPNIQPIPSPPIKIHQVTEERLEMLARLPRLKWNEYAWAALGGTAASLPSAVEALWSSMHRTPISMEPFEVVQLLISVGFAVWFFSQRSVSEMTSRDLLAKLISQENTARR